MKKQLFYFSILITALFLSVENPIEASSMKSFSSDDLNVKQFSFSDANLQIHNNSVLEAIPESPLENTEEDEDEYKDEIQHSITENPAFYTIAYNTQNTACWKQNFALSTVIPFYILFHSWKSFLH